MSSYIMTANGWKPLMATFAPCPNSNDLQGVFRPQTIEEAQFETGRRARNYELDVTAHIEGKVGKEKIFRAFGIAMYGAFGEKL